MKNSQINWRLLRSNFPKAFKKMLWWINKTKFKVTPFLVLEFVKCSKYAYFALPSDSNEGWLYSFYCYTLEEGSSAKTERDFYATLSESSDAIYYLFQGIEDSIA